MQDINTIKNVPVEMWAMITSYLCLKDLKNVRLVHCYFHMVVNPRLFRRACLSLSPLVWSNIDAWSQHHELAVYVDTLTLDLTQYDPCLDSQDYAVLSSQHFARLLGPQGDGPLCQVALQAVLDTATRQQAHSAPTDQSCEIPGYLTGGPLSAFRTGFRAYQVQAVARHHQCLPFNMYQEIENIVSRFPNLRRLESVHAWWQNCEAGKQFAIYLDQQQPRSPTQTQGCRAMATAPVVHGGILQPGPFSGPGQTARELPWMQLPPGQSTDDEYRLDVRLLECVLYAVDKRSIRLKSINLPSNAAVEAPTLPVAGVPSSIFTTANRSWRPQATMLAQATELSAHLDCRYVLRLDCSIDDQLFASTIMTMSQLQSIEVGFAKDTSAPWSVYDTLLWGEAKPPDDAIRGSNPLGERMDEFNSGRRPIRQQSFHTGFLDRFPLPPRYITPYRPHPCLRTSEALKICPWPMLRRLCLWNMTFSEHDLCCLLQTVRSTLEQFSLLHVGSGGHGADRKSPASNWLAVLGTLERMPNLRGCRVIMTEQDKKNLHQVLEISPPVLLASMDDMVCRYVLAHSGLPLVHWAATIQR